MAEITKIQIPSDNNGQVKIEFTDVHGFRAAIRGMRASMSSWDRSDTIFGSQKSWPGILVDESPSIGVHDFNLMSSLVKAGPAHRKFTRNLHVSVDLVIPLMIWTELDTHHGDLTSHELSSQTVRLSCSTVHKLGSRDLVKEDFIDCIVDPKYLIDLNLIGLDYRYAKAKKAGPEIINGLLHELKCKLPSGYLLRSTWEANYETLFNLYHLRKSHRLPEWQPICRWIETLPYMREFLHILEST